MLVNKHAVKSALKGVALVFPSLLVGNQPATINWFRQKGSSSGITQLDNFALFFDNKDGLVLTALMERKEDSCPH